MSYITSEPLKIIGVRELQFQDLPNLLAPLARRAGEPSPGISPLKKIRESHHNLARAIVTSRNQQEAAAAAGYTPARVAMLMQDPAFIDLVQKYRAQMTEAVVSLQARMLVTVSDLVDEYQDRLEADPSAFDLSELRQGIRLFADRTGHGPSSTLEVNVNDPRRIEIERLKARAREVAEAIVVRDDLGDTRPALSALPTNGPGAHDGLTLDGRAGGSGADAAGEPPGEREGSGGAAVRETSLPRHLSLVPWVGDRPVDQVR